MNSTEESAAAEAGVEKPFLELSRTYFRALQEAQRGAQERLRSAVQQYFGGIQVPPDDVRHFHEEAQRDYPRAYRDAAATVRKRWIDAHDEFVKATHEAREELGARWEEAYREYVKSLPEAWAGVDVSKVDPATVVAISRSIGAAAWITWAYRGLG